MGFSAVFLVSPSRCCCSDFFVPLALSEHAAARLQHVLIEPAYPSQLYSKNIVRALILALLLLVDQMEYVLTEAAQNMVLPGMTNDFVEGCCCNSMVLLILDWQVLHRIAMLS